MGDRTAFFYGTLMAPGVLFRVIYGTHNPEEWQKKLTTVRPALLQSYRRHRVKHAEFPAIIPRESSSVRGTYVTGLTEGDIYRLDIFEGDMYIRERVNIKILNESVSLKDTIDESKLDEVIVGETQTETYVWQLGVDTLEEKEWDFQEFQREKMQAWMGISKNEETEVDDGFADVDRAVAQEEQRQREQGSDPTGLKADPSGGRVNGKIAKDLASAGV